MRRMSRRVGAHSTERGAVAIIMSVAIVFIAGFAALTIDSGQIFNERRQLQNGADAAALAIARDCATGNCGTYNTTAQGYLDSNANDGKSGLAAVTFPTANSVKVTDQTLDASGTKTTIQYQFAPVAGLTSKTVHASATATWGAPGAFPSLPFIFSLCEWNAATNSGLGPFPTGPRMIILQGGGTPSDCAAQAGQDRDGDTRLPGGFGWLEQSNCAAVISLQLIVQAKTGAGSPSCLNLSNLIDPLKQPVLIPVFDDFTVAGWGSCPSRCYQVKGFAAMHITGIDVPGLKGGVVPDCKNASSPPSSSNKCIGGWFEQFVGAGVPIGPPGSGLGVVVFSLTG